MELRKFIRNAIRGYLNEQKSFDDVKLNDNFWEWFGYSRVVDKNENPLEVYHGTKYNHLKIFDLGMVGKNTDCGMFGKGFYFTDNIKYASTYHRGSGMVLSCFLSIQNPLIINSKNDIPEINVPYESIEDMYNAPINYSKMFREFLIDNNFDGVIDNLSDIRQFVVLNSNQIKSVHNDGSWDADDDNIYS